MSKKIISLFYPISDRLLSSNRHTSAGWYLAVEALSSLGGPEHEVAAKQNKFRVTKRIWHAYLIFVYVFRHFSPKSMVIGIL